MKKYVFGVDIGGSSVKIGLFLKNGILLRKWKIPTNTENNSSGILPDTADSIRKQMEEENISQDEVIGVGVGVPSAIDERGVTVGVAANLGWGVVDVAGTLNRLLGLPVKAANDANAAALGEMWQGGGRGYRNLVFVTLGTGVGGGIIINGEILVGACGGAGEIGHIHLNDEETEFCGCGNRGCLEQYASAPGIVRLAERYIASGGDPGILEGKRLNTRSIVEAARAGDPAGKKIMDQFGFYLGKGLAAIGVIVNPDIFVIGGGVSEAGEMLFEYIRPYYREYSIPSCRDTAFALAELKNDAGIYGGAALFFKDF